MPPSPAEMAADVLFVEVYDRLKTMASRELARRLGGLSQLIELDSSFGHDAFLGDSARIAPLINELLRARVEALS